MKKTIEKRLDKAFSDYIRKRDTKDGYGKCCSCGRLKPYSELDCGHFINRKWRATRWHEENSHAQCIACNRFGESDAGGYALFMLDKYGREKIEYLRALSRETAKFTDIEGELMVKAYRDKLKAL
jgi:5-methylcytosine-specific restriction endonuclease McrA